MVELNQKTIDAIQLISEVIKSTAFEINHFKVFDSASGETRIELDIVEKESEKKNG